jgi:putative endonuclease
VAAKRCWVYILANPWSHVLYVGVTSDIIARVGTHKSGQVASFTQRYKITALVYIEEFSGPSEAIAREKQIKSWRRDKKIALIETMNPDFRDLAEEL